MAGNNSAAGTPASGYDPVGRSVGGSRHHERQRLRSLLCRRGKSQVRSGLAVDEFDLPFRPAEPLVP
jgi:hypothetical protein